MKAEEHENLMYKIFGFKIIEERTMKTHEITTSKGEFVVVDIIKSIDEAYEDGDVFYKLICKLSEATEEDAKLIVDENKRGYYYYVRHINSDGSNTTTSSIESLHTLLKSKVIDIDNGNWYLFKKI